MTISDPHDPLPRDDDRNKLRGLMRWWRGLGLAVVLLAVYLFSEQQDVAGYIALAIGWAILIYAIVQRSRQRRQMHD